ncbi:hypothetical protein JYU34_022029 [Plutella xylostella]|uniref:Uncharacterized protein n=1 Tax=Plutella xylostella TaxID=51655 RepID=A0ABQ7PRQ6_PLUXY|nr:hypothetical protein JYU34_022029 [Plutella xylostella]
MESEISNKAITSTTLEDNAPTDLMAHHMALTTMSDGLLEKNVEDNNMKLEVLDEFKITEIKPVAWKSVCGLLALGLIQVIASAVLAVFSLDSGALLVFNLATEGINDIIYAVKEGIINRNIDWATFLIQKVLSLSISVMFAGVLALKDVVNTCKSGFKNNYSEITKEGFQLVGKKVVMELSKGIAKETISEIATHGLKKTVMPTLRFKLLERPIHNAIMNNKCVEALLLKDLKNKSTKYANFIKASAFELLDTSNQNKITDIGLKISIAIADSKGFIGTRKITQALFAVNEVSTFLPSFLNDLKIRIEAKAKQDVILGEHEECQAFTSVLNPNAPIETNNDQIEPVEIKKEEIEMYVSRLCDVLIKGFGYKFMSKVIHPVIQVGVGYSMDKITSKIEGPLHTDIENYRAMKRQLHYQSHGYNEFINHTNFDDSDPKTQKAIQIINDSELGGKVGLYEMGAICKETKRPIEVYNDRGGLQFTIAGNKNVTPIKVQYHKDIQHYTMLGGKEPVTLGKEPNMCLYNVISEQCGTDPDALKAATVARMKKNIVEFSKQSADITRLEKNDPMRLCPGGAKYDGVNANDAARILDNSDGNFCVYPPGNYRGPPPPGHPRGHAVNPGANNSVEQYSMHGDKSAFNSIDIQNYACHKALTHSRTQDAMNSLNQGSYREVLTLTTRELDLGDEWSKASKWSEGRRVYDFDYTNMQLVIGHHNGSYKDPTADVFITSFYPRYR